MKKYMAPVTEILYLETSSMVCASPDPKVVREDEISDNDSGNPYQNPDWYQNDPIEDDYGDLNATAKSSTLWE